MRDRFGVPAVVSINKFLSDTDAEIVYSCTHVESMNVQSSSQATGPMVDRGR